MSRKNHQRPLHLHQKSRNGLDFPASITSTGQCLGRAITARTRAMAVQQRESATVRYMEHPELREVFADSLHSIAWDGQTMRLEFCVTRHSEAASAGAPAEATRHPACRLVLTAPAVATLYNRLQQTVTAMAEAGLIAKAPPQT
jgi:hypothetical protein